MSLTVRILLGLALGLAVGITLAALDPPWLDAVVDGAQTVGSLWLDALRMTILPLVFALLVTSIASAAGTMRAGGAAARALALFAVLLVLAGAFSALVSPLILELWPVSAESSRALLAGAGGADVPDPPPTSEWLRSLVPSNVVKSAADGNLAPVVIFALVFALAATRAPRVQTERLTGFFEAVASTMLVIVGWVLWAAPFGVFALSLVLGARTGLQAVGTLGQYVAVVSIVLILLTLLMYLVGWLGGRVPLGRFTAAMAPVTGLAFSTQSSLACLPAMVVASGRIGVPERITGLVVPMAVSLFRVTSPAGNVAVAFYVAQLHGIELGLPQIIAGVLMAATVSVGLVGLPSALTFFTSLGPIFITMGVPLDTLPLLLAVEALPDIWRTVGNVTGHVASAAVVARGEEDQDPPPLAGEVARSAGGGA